MIPEDSSKYPIGCRVDVVGSKGTVMYYGKVVNTEGFWLGIDWDDPKRGKHDGCVMGVRYFTARFPTSGSFIRPKNANTGITIVEGIQSRYSESKDIGKELDLEMSEIQQAIRASVFEVVGVDQLKKHLMNSSAIHTVVLHGMPVSSAGPPMELSLHYPNIEELHLGETLIGSWQTVYEIVSQLKRISILNLSSNMIKHADNLDPEAFSTLEHLVLAKMNYTWDDMLKCFDYIPNVETVQMPYNRITTLREPPAHVFAKLVSLDLTGNKIESWHEVNKLGGLSTLSTLNLTDCGLKEVRLPSGTDSARPTTPLFPKLTVLALNLNSLDSWSDMSELDKLQSLTDLRIRDNPLLNDNSPEYNFRNVVARIVKLQKLNGITVKDERKPSEMDFLKEHSLEWLNVKTEDERKEFLQKYPCFLRLVELYGLPDAYSLTEQNRSLKHALVELDFFAVQDPKVTFRKKVPDTISVLKLRSLCQKLFRVDNPVLRLLYPEAKGEPEYEIPLDIPLRQLNFYSVQNGSKIAVSW